MTNAADFTSEQKDIVNHQGSAFVAACPGAGKTRVLAGRASILQEDNGYSCGVAFLSFTNAAVHELENRLRAEGLIRSPVFPDFIGTFDSFLWHHLVAPFGVKGSHEQPSLIPDLEEVLVAPFQGAQPLPLFCFCPSFGKIIPESAATQGFNIAHKRASMIEAYETTALRIRERHSSQALLSYDSARREALDRIQDPSTGPIIGAALQCRFREIIVDEAQDCNPDDLMIISWLKSYGIPVKVMCDPHQAIYKFRGGVTDHLLSFSEEFSACTRKQLTGNFRSSPNICKAIIQFQARETRGESSDPLGPLNEDRTPVLILSYSGTSVPSSIGVRYASHLKQKGMDPDHGVVVAATKASGNAAVGNSKPVKKRDKVIRLAESVAGFRSASTFHESKAILQEVHQIVLELEGKPSKTSYHEYVKALDIDEISWRPRILSLIEALQFNPKIHFDARSWHDHIKDYLSNELEIGEGASISQKLKWNAELESVLRLPKQSTIKARTIHSVKGQEFPSVCVVTTAQTMKGTLDFLQNGYPQNKSEEARKLYVAVSRAQKFLVIAAPKSQATRLRDYLGQSGTEVGIEEI
jgi:DNA helicase-2/ATP-dependent DNA helicase PcrA